MNPVNLLPTKHRPRTATGGQQGSAYVVVGIMAAILVLLVFYVLTVNGINTRKSQVARAKAETAQAQARASSLSSYGDFSKVKTERVQSVKDLAQNRIDWERLTRGLARVLPNNVWLLTASASASGQISAGGSGGAAPSQPSGGSSSTAATGPKVELTGCAPGQADVATTLVRLRELSGATDVQLNDITRPAQTASTTTPAAGAAAGSGGSGTDCGDTHGTPNDKWDATVTFDTTAGSAQGTQAVPNSLGGGA
ncbi:MAG: hypothetical protein QOK25_2581 [Thermoleophilaceae bacterium]|nr:hypothetical protein [Thermoleophilaceae bacterium]